MVGEGVFVRWSGIRQRGVVAVLVLLLAAVGGGAIAPPASAASSITLVGHGWGHGRGLGQWGAFGYAVDHGWSSARILNHFYGGTSPGSRANETISVQLTAWTGKTMAVTSGSPFQVGTFGTVGTTPNTMIEVFQSGGRWWMNAWEGGCGRTGGPYGPYEIGHPTVTPSAPGESMASLLTLCGATERRTYRGGLRVVAASGTTHVINDVVMESYLRGVVPREVPASWGDAGTIDPGTGRPRGFQALAAQAVAARSYAFAENRAPGLWKTCDTTSCQVYSGAFLNGSALEDPRTDAAISATSGVVRVRNGSTVRTEFSASTGGWTAGGEFPPVEDLGDVRSPQHSWKKTLTAAQIQSKYPTIGQFTGLRTQHNGLGSLGGRVLSVQVLGTSGTVTVTGNQFRSAFACTGSPSAPGCLPSDWFASQGPTQLSWAVRQSPSPGSPLPIVPFGGPTDRALGCDFDGNRADGVTVYQGDTFYGRSTVTGGNPEVTARYGAPQYVPVCGNWDGIGGDGIGVFVDGWWYLRNTPTPGPPDLVINFGYAGVTPVVGDWDGDGRDGIGIFDAGRWYLRQTPSPGSPDIAFDFGLSGYVPVVGDWDGLAGDGIGVFVGGEWYLRNFPSPGAAELGFAYGSAANRPVVGNWDGVGADGIGVVYPE